MQSLSGGAGTFLRSNRINHGIILMNQGADAVILVSQLPPPVHAYANFFFKGGFLEYANSFPIILPLLALLWNEYGE
ncbi:hypothetical protein HHJ49_00040 [Escherichia coli]|nr:hypothetical protein HHJ49_00040 [Escherichia coli]